MTHSLATDRPGTWYPEARSPLLSRRHRTAIFLVARHWRTAHRENEITDNAALRFSFDRGRIRDREPFGNDPLMLSDSLC